MKSQLNEVIRDAARILGNLDMLSYDASGPGQLVINIDGYAASLSRLPFMSLSDWGYKATIAAASDVITAGARPNAIAFSVGLTSIDKVMDVVSGVSDASRALGALVYKADTNRSLNDDWIDVAVVGVSTRKVSRAGAKPGDAVVQVGYVGYGAVADRVLKGSLRLSDVPETVINAIRRPKPLVGVSDIIARYASASSDNSDGWLATLYNISQSSNVRIDLESIVLDPELEGLISEEEGLNSWEDYNIAITVPSDLVDEVLRMCDACHAVGKVMTGSGVYFNGRLLDVQGWSWW